VVEVAFVVIAELEVQVALEPMQQLAVEQ